MSWVQTLAATARVVVPVREVVGKQRPRTDYRNHRTYTPTKTLKAEKEVRDAWRAEYGETFAGHDGPVRMRISTYRPLAKSNPKYWEGRSDMGKPDWDNVGKLVCDSLNGLAFKDDPAGDHLHRGQAPEALPRDATVYQHLHRVLRRGVREGEEMKHFENNVNDRHEPHRQHRDAYRPHQLHRRERPHGGGRRGRGPTRRTRALGGP